ncbi:uncharacterized protein METZ01_LOCUS105480 [marine metagenome]|uniref:Uncharacterized protein n=1 Tax=marine metagenome TaxID=408172 RepID=A0A381WJE7_9ZZZZ
MESTKYPCVPHNHLRNQKGSAENNSKFLVVQLQWIYPAQVVLQGALSSYLHV